MESSSDLQKSLASFASGGDCDVQFRRIADQVSGLIYHSALRQTRNAALAEEVVQNVLLLIARKAGRLARHPRVLAWVHEATRLEVLQMKRAAGRRMKREEQAMRMMTEPSESEPALLDELDLSLASLNDAERELVLMRFFEGRTIPAIAARTGRSESAEKMRLKRALEKLSRWFGKRGMTMSVAGLTTVLSSEMSKAAPTGLVTGMSGAGVVAAGSGKIAAGVGLLVAAGMSVPILSSWGEVRELEKRVTILAGSEITNSERRMGAGSSRRGVSGVLRLAEEKMNLDEIVSRATWASVYEDRLENEILKKQVIDLTREELVEVARRLNANYGTGNFLSNVEGFVHRELRDRLAVLTPQERLAFLIPLPVSIAVVLEEFEEWSENAPLEEVGSWLETNGELLSRYSRGSAHQIDLKGKMWEHYLGGFGVLGLEEAVRVMNAAALSNSQKAKCVDHLGSGQIRENDRLVARQYQLTSGGLRYSWGKAVMKLIGDDFGNFDVWMSERDLVGEDRRGLLVQALGNLHPKLKKKNFPDRLEWLRRNLPAGEWGEMIDSGFVRNYGKQAGEDDFFSEGFEETFSGMTPGLEKEALAFSAASLLGSRRGLNDAEGVAETISYLTEIANGAKRGEAVRNWLWYAGKRKPAMVPVIEAGLEDAGLGVEGRGQ